MPGIGGTAGREPVAMTKVFAVSAAAADFERVRRHEAALAEDHVDAEAAKALGTVEGLDLAR